MSRHQAVLAEIAKIDKELEALNQSRLAWRAYKANEENNKNQVVTTILGVATVAVLGFLGWSVFKATPSVESYSSPRYITNESYSASKPVSVPKNIEVNREIVPESVDGRTAKIYAILNKEIKERCPIKDCSHFASSNDKGEIIVRMSWPVADSKGKIIGIDSKEWISEASVIFKNQR